MTPITSSEIKILRLKGELDGLRPLHGAALANLASWYDVEMTYTSNAIEGNTLTRSETAIIIEKGVTISGKSLAEHNEAIDHHDAVGAMRAIVARGTPPLRGRRPGIAQDRHGPIKADDRRQLW